MVIRFFSLYFWTDAEPAYGGVLKSAPLCWFHWTPFGSSPNFQTESIIGNKIIKANYMLMAILVDLLVFYELTFTGSRKFMSTNSSSNLFWKKIYQMINTNRKAELRAEYTVHCESQRAKSTNKPEVEFPSKECDAYSWTASMKRTTLNPYFSTYGLHPQSNQKNYTKQTYEIERKT